MDGGTRHAMAINERARHEPQRSGDGARLNHPARGGKSTSAPFRCARRSPVTTGVDRGASVLRHPARRTAAETIAAP